jgi:hypothetical protein
MTRSLSRLFHNVHHRNLAAEAAYGCLKPPPAGRLRRVHLHLSYSMVLAHLLDTSSPFQQVAAATVVTRPRRPTDRRSRPQRWRDAVDTLLTLQAGYADWLAALPDGLQRSATADALEAIVDLDLTPLADVEPPRGYGRD